MKPRLFPCSTQIFRCQTLWRQRRWDCKNRWPKMIGDHWITCCNTKTHKTSLIFFLFITSTFLRFFTCILRNHNEYRSIPALFHSKDSKWKKTKAMSFRWNVIRIIPSRTRIKHEVYEIRALAFEFNFYCWSKKEKKNYVSISICIVSKKRFLFMWLASICGCKCTLHANALFQFAFAFIFAPIFRLSVQK